MFTFVVLSVIKISFVFFTSFSNSGYIVSFVLEFVFFFELFSINIVAIMVTNVEHLLCAYFNFAGVLIVKELLYNW